MAKHKGKASKSGIVFILVAAMLAAGVYLAWPLIIGRGNPRLGILRSEDTIHIAAREAPQSLDIRTETDLPIEQAFLGNVYQTLLTPDPQGNPAPGLAQSWDVSTDGLIYTFHIRADARFADGRVLDSSDALWSLQQIVEKQYVGHEWLTNLAKVNTPSTTTLTIGLSKPDAHLPRALCGRAGIVYDRQAQVNYSVASAGSGPYKVKDWRPGSSLTLTGNDQYKGPDTAKTATVVLTYNSQDANAVEQVQKGTLDAIVDLTPTEAAPAEEAADGAGSEVKLSTGPSQNNLVLAFNNSPDSLFSDQHVREAVRYALDRQSLASLEARGAKPLGGPLNEMSPGFDAGLQAFPHDSEKASQFASYYSQSYYKGGLRLVYQDTYGRQIGDMIASQLSAVGIPSRVTMVDRPTFRDQVLNRHDYDMTILTMDNDQIGRFADPNTTMLFDNRSVQDAWNQVLGSANQEEYAARLGSYARQVSDLSPSDWLYARTPRILASSRLQGMPHTMVDQYLPLWNLEVRR